MDSPARRVAVGPGRGRLDLGGQRRAAAPPRPAGPPASRRPAARRRPVQRQRDGRHAGDVPRRGPGREAPSAPRSPRPGRRRRGARRPAAAVRRGSASARRRTAPGRSGSRPRPAHRADRQAELRAAHRPPALGQPPGQRPQQRPPAPAAPADSAVSTAQQVSNVGTASRGIGTAMSSTSWPSDASRARGVDSQAATHSGSTSASAITGSMKRAIRSRPGSRSQAARNDARRRRSPGRVADAPAGQHVEQGGRVADGAASVPAVREPGDLAVHRAAADPAARGLEPDEAAAARQGSGSSRRRRSPGPPAPVPRPRRPRHRPTSRRPSGSGPTASPPAARRRARCSRASRTPGCWSCRG